MNSSGISIAEISKRLRCVRQSVSLYLLDPENYVQNSERGLKPSHVTPSAQYLADKKKFQSNANTMLSHHHFQRFDYTEGTSKKVRHTAIFETIQNVILEKFSILKKDKKSSHQDEIRFKPMSKLTGKNYRVLHKYRAVIEFLTKCGQTPSWIQKEIERVYSVVIDLSCIQFWAAPFQKDRPKIGQKRDIIVKQQNQYKNIQNIYLSLDSLI